MFPRCCPWAGRLVVLAVLAVGLGVWAGCNCESCSKPAAPQGTGTAKDFGPPPSDCALSKSAQGTCCESEGACKEGDCEKCPLCSGKDDKKAAAPAEQVALADNAKGDKVPTALSFTMKSLDGKTVELAKYQGKVVVFVNVASKCGYTPQYKGLQQLHEKYADKGLAVVGVPANEFGKQEPGTNDEIAEFCSKNYGVKFDMLEKVVVKGNAQCDLYKFLTKESKFPGDIKWNFEKFVVGRNGEVVARFDSKTKPESPEFIKAIEDELAKK